MAASRVSHWHGGSDVPGLGLGTRMVSQNLHLLIREDPQAKDVNSDTVCQYCVGHRVDNLTYQNSRVGAGRSYDGSVAKHGVQSLGGIIICSWRRVAKPHVTAPPVDFAHGRTISITLSWPRVGSPFLRLGHFP